jgi:hypothetical protein
MPITSKTLRSWNEIHSLRDSFKRGWLFRGQEGKNRPLQTSLERCCDGWGIKPKDRSKIESNLIRDFKRMYHQYAQHIPERESTLEWMSLMQHHGAPTRLLDFTYSIYVAAYFALEKAKSGKAKSDYAIWAVDGVWLMDQTMKRLRGDKNKNENTKEAAKWLPEPTQEYHELVYNTLLSEQQSTKFVFFANPFRLNLRLNTQNGAFIAPGTVSDSFMKNLLALKGHEQRENCIKIVIPHGLREEALEQLFYMNISRKSLFPGLDGYAGSLGVFHPTFRPDRFKKLRLKSVKGIDYKGVPTEEGNHPPSP